MALTRWDAKVERYDGDDVHVDTWRTTVEADTETAAQHATLQAYGELYAVGFSDTTSFSVRVQVCP